MTRWKSLESIREQCRKYRIIIQKKYPKRVQTIKFLTALILLAIPLYAVMESSFSLYWIEKFYATAVQKTLEFQGYAVNQTTAYETLTLTMPVLEVNGLEPVGFGRACTGYRSLLALFALIFAVPGISLKRKLKGFLALTPIILVANYFRTYTTILSGMLFGQSVFESVHLVLWREGLIILVLALWVLWLKREKKRKARK